MHICREGMLNKQPIMSIGHAIRFGNHLVTVVMHALRIHYNNVIAMGTGLTYTDILVAIIKKFSDHNLIMVVTFWSINTILSSITQPSHNIYDLPGDFDIYALYRNINGPLKY